MIVGDFTRQPSGARKEQKCVHVSEKYIVDRWRVKPFLSAFVLLRSGEVVFFLTRCCHSLQTSVLPPNSGSYPS